jgi:hypothetical protein
MRSIAALLLLLAASFAIPAAESPNFEEEAPRVRAALEQAQAAEAGRGVRRNIKLALALYCEAGSMGSPEGFFRVGRLLTQGPAYARNPRLANAYLALAASLGHREAMDRYDEAVGAEELPEDDCGQLDNFRSIEGFDMDAYVAGLAPARREVAAIIRRLAPQFGVDARIALAVALTESNLNPLAVSPKNAQGVMQLIPETAERFGVKKPFDPESNVRGGLAYLRWLEKRFNGDWEHAVAAYNAGEGNVDRYKGIPPFRETRQYVKRVLYFAGYAPAGKS